MAKNKGHENLIPWQPGQSGNPKGRPRKIETVLKKTGYTKDNIREVMSELPFYSMDELLELSEDKTKPIIMQIVGRSLYKAASEGNWHKAKDIIDQVIGKATKPIETPQADEEQKATYILPDGSKLEM